MFSFSGTSLNYKRGEPAHANESTCCQSTCPRRAPGNQDGASASPSNHHFAFTQSMTQCLQMKIWWLTMNWFKYLFLKLLSRLKQREQTKHLISQINPHKLCDEKCTWYASKEDCQLLVWRRVISWGRSFCLPPPQWRGKALPLWSCYSSDGKWGRPKV